MSLENAFEKLEQLVYDENRIVTYKILSRELGIHVNKAKQYLFEFLRKHRTRENNLDAYYFLTGYQETNDASKVMKIVVVSQEKVEETKRLFNVLTSCHIYSVNKGKHTDECSLYTTDHAYTKNKEEQTKFSAVKHLHVKIQPPVLNKYTAIEKDHAKPSVPKKEKSITTSKSNSLSSVWQKKDDKSVQKPKAANSFESAKPKDEILAQSNGSKTSPVNDSISCQKKEDPRVEFKGKKSPFLSSMWQKKDETTNEKPKNEKVAEAKANKKNPAALVKTSSKNSLANMFSRQAEKKSGATKKSDEEIGQSRSEKQSPALEMAKINGTKCEPETQKLLNEKSSKSKPQKRKTAQRETSRKVKAKNCSDSEEEFQPKKKKHKRICRFQDSDSDSECEEEQDKAQRQRCGSEEPLADVAVSEISDNDEELIPPTPPAVLGKRKMWKTVTKMHEDEEGFFVTKQEKQLVSTSEDSDSEEPLKEIKEKSVKKEIVNKNTLGNKKQASLTSFFNMQT